MDRKYRIKEELIKKYGLDVPKEVETKLPYEISGVSDRYISVLIENGYAQLVDVGEATLDELIDLDGIGETMAKKILSEV